MLPRGREKKPDGSFSITAAARSADLQQLKHSSEWSSNHLSITHSVWCEETHKKTQHWASFPFWLTAHHHMLTQHYFLVFFQRICCTFFPCISSPKSAKLSLHWAQLEIVNLLFFRSLLATSYLCWDQSTNKTLWGNAVTTHQEPTWSPPNTSRDHANLHPYRL